MTAERDQSAVPGFYPDDGPRGGRWVLVVDGGGAWALNAAATLATAKRELPAGGPIAGCLDDLIAALIEASPE
jgi:hypothetical protein